MISVSFSWNVISVISSTRTIQDDYLVFVFLRIINKKELLKSNTCSFLKIKNTKYREEKSFKISRLFHGDSNFKVPTFRCAFPIIPHASKIFSYN